MFGDGFFSGMRMKFMSALTTGLFASTSIMMGADQTTTINEIKKELRTDGHSFSYEAIEHFDSMSTFKDILGSSGNQDMKQAESIFSTIEKISKDLGFYDFDGYGSSTAKEGDLYDSDMFFHFKPGNEKSVLWKVIGGDAAPLKTFDLLPENTILAKTFRIDLQSLWGYLKAQAPNIKIPDAPPVDQLLPQFEQMAAQQGMPVDAVTKALSTEASIFVSMNEGRTMQVPDVPVPLPQMGVTLLMEKKSDFIQNYLLQILANAPTQKLNIGGFNIVTVNENLPTGTKAGIAYNDNYFMISSDIKIVQKVIAAKSGKGLIHSSKFAKYSSLKRNGNMAVYVSREISDKVSEIRKTLPPEASMIMASYAVMLFQDKSPEAFMIAGKKKNGMKIDMLSSFQFQSSAMISVSVIGVLAAMILPALGKARSKAKQAKSKSHLKQMGLSVAVYFSDGDSSAFPDYKKLEFEEAIFQHPETGRKVSLADVFAGKGDYIPLFKKGDTYTGSADTPLFVEKPGIRPSGIVYVVYQDGHVSSTYGTTLEEIKENLK